MKNLLLVVALTALPLAAQDQKKEEPKEPQVQRLFVLKYADPQQVSNLIKVFTGNVTPNAPMHAIAVSATAPVLVAIEDAIKRLDVPASAPQDVELTAYLMTGTDADGTPPNALPKELDSVVTQLRTAFAYKNYKLGEVLTLRGRTGQRLSTSGSGGAVVIGGAAQAISTEFNVEALSVGPDGAIRVDGLRVSNRVPYATGLSVASGGPTVNTQFSYQNVGLSTDVDIKEGQKVVVGKMAMNPNEAMFLVLMARVIQ
jgi:hypothetical protein